MVSYVVGGATLPHWLRIIVSRDGIFRGPAHKGLQADGAPGPGYSEKEAR